MEAKLEALKAINYWDSDPEFDLGFVREKYNAFFRNAMNNKLIKVIVGQRRAGKSFVVRQLMHKLIFDKKVNKKNLFYLNKELFEFDEIRTATELSELIKLYEKTYKPKGRVYLFFDEIQDVLQWEKLIVSLSQHPVKDYEIVITGSNSSLLSGELASLLSGRYLLLEVFPFSYREYLIVNNLENCKASFIEYITNTGLPERQNLTSSDTVYHYFQSLKNTILLKDIMYRYKIRDYVLLEDIFLFLLHNVGKITSVPAILKYFKNKNRKSDYTTISQYLSYMQDAFLIHEAARYSVKTREFLSGEKKYYVNDMGFRNFLFPSLLNDFGSMLENVVYLHLRMAGYKTNVVSATNFEVDFIAEKSTEKWYIQVSYIMELPETVEREFGALEKIRDSNPKIVVSMDEMLIHNPNGIKHEHIWDFVYNLV
jgi:predicted AAA+ superfamily ATPase